jgi:hypothetical protein
MIATMHRIVMPMSFVLLCLLASASSASAATLDLKIPTLKSSPGQQVVVPILVKANQGIGSLELELVFDPKVLEFTSLDQGSLLPGALISSNVIEPGRLVVALATGEPVRGEGDLLELRFQVRLDAKAGTSALSLEKVRAWEHGPNILEMLAKTQPGQIDVGSPSWPAWIYGAIAAAVLVLIIAVVIVRRNRTS